MGSARLCKFLCKVAAGAVEDIRTHDGRVSVHVCAPASTNVNSKQKQPHELFRSCVCEFDDCSLQTQVLLVPYGVQTAVTDVTNDIVIDWIYCGA